MVIPEQDERMVEWYVCFVDRGTRRWWNLFTNTGFRHCYAVGRWGSDWVKLDYLRCWTQVDVIRQADVVASGFEDYPDFLKKVDKARVLRVTRFMPVRTIPFILPLNCVSMIKSLLGIKSFVCTPFGLYLKLMEMPNVVVV